MKFKQFFFPAIVLISLFSQYAHGTGFGYVVKVPAANIYKEQSITSGVVGVLHITDPIFPSDTLPNGGRWIRYDTSSISNGVSGWIQLSQVAATESFSRVIGCWPIKEIGPPEGESWYSRIKFTPQGKAKFVDVMEKEWPAEILMVDNLVLVRATRKSKDAPFGEFFSFDPKTERLSPRGEYPSYQLPAPASVLKKCSGPILSFK